MREFVHGLCITFGFEMMKFIVIADVHGNLPALQVMLKSVINEGYDFVFHLGDVIAIGPYPAECLDRLLNVPRMRFVMGNHDAWFVNGLPNPIPVWMSEGEVEHQNWTHMQIRSEFKQIIAEWPYLLQENFAGVSATFLHYGLNDLGRDFVSIIREPQQDELDMMFGDFGTDLVFYGHHHPFSDVNGTSRYINPGSLGCCNQPVARYTIVRCDGGKFAIEHRVIAYDDHELLQAFEARKVPERAFLYKAFFGDRFAT